MINAFLYGFIVLLVYFLMAASLELMDLYVAAALASAAVFPGSQAAYYMDTAGSAAVALYLIINGAGILRKSSRKPQIAGSLT